MKQVAGSLKIEFANYRENLSFSQFGSDLDPETKKILTHGAVAMEALKQRNYAPLSMIQEVVELFAVQNKFLDDLPLPEVSSFLSVMYTYIEDTHKQLLKKLTARRKSGSKGWLLV
jgi:F-type H+-transporting ATPase subunit alpha